jgi:hypothetical protein
MVKIEAVLHPEEAELVWTMLNRAATQLTREPASPAIDDPAESGVAAQAPGIAGSDDSAESRGAIEPTSRRGVSVLRQRADAAQRAFSRADALVSIAQGYLRGDRPDRSPIDITITIPESSLRAQADLADPVEVGEMGESLLSEGGGSRLAVDPRGERAARDRREHGRLRMGWNAGQLRDDRRTSCDRRWSPVMFLVCQRAGRGAVDEQQASTDLVATRAEPRIGRGDHLLGGAEVTQRVGDHLVASARIRDPW